MKAAIIAIITIALVTAVLFTVDLGATPSLLAVSQETPAQTIKVDLKQPTVQSAVSGASEAYSTNDPYLSHQWALDRVPALLTNGDSSKVLIAVLDTGIDQNHEDLAGKVVTSVNFSKIQTMADGHGHGTHIAGIIAAATNNGLGIAGIAPNARLLNVKVADDNGIVWSSSVTQGIVWAVDHGANVINMGFFVPATSAALEQAIEYAWSNGTVLVAAAGNDIKSVPIYPAYYPEVIAVGATDVSGHLWSKSNYGEWVDTYAPGVDIYSTFPGNNYGYQSGTSVASAYVSGVAALAFASVTDTNGNGLVNDEVATLLKAVLALPE